MLYSQYKVFLLDLVQKKFKRQARGSPLQEKNDPELWQREVGWSASCHAAIKTGLHGRYIATAGKQIGSNQKQGGQWD